MTTCLHQNTLSTHGAGRRYRSLVDSTFTLRYRLGGGFSTTHHAQHALHSFARAFLNSTCRMVAAEHACTLARTVRSAMHTALPDVTWIARAPLAHLVWIDSGLHSLSHCYAAYLARSHQTFSFAGPRSPFGAPLGGKLLVILAVVHSYISWSDATHAWFTIVDQNSAVKHVCLVVAPPRY